MYYFILFAFLVSLTLRGNLLILDQQLSIMASSPAQSPSTLKPYKEECSHKPRFKRNLGGICFFNATTEILHRIYCNEAFRKTLLTVPSTAMDNDSIFRRITIQMLQDYENQQINDIQFAENYDIYAATVASLNIKRFNICENKGGFPSIILPDILNRLTGKSKDHINITNVNNTSDFPIRIITLLGSRDSSALYKQSKSFTTMLEEDLFEFTVSNDYDRWRIEPFDWPPLLLISFDGFKMMMTFNAYEKNKQQPYKPFTFPEIFDITKCFLDLSYLPAKQYPKLNPVYYRLCAIIMQSPQHASSIIRHNTHWYWSSDEYIAQYSDTFIIDINRKLQENAPKGNVLFFRKGGDLKLLSDDQQAIVTIRPQEARFSFPALPATFLYERVD